MRNKKDVSFSVKYVFYFFMLYLFFCIGIHAVQYYLLTDYKQEYMDNISKFLPQDLCEDSKAVVTLLENSISSMDIKYYSFTPNINRFLVCKLGIKHEHIILYYVILLLVINILAFLFINLWTNYFYKLKLIKHTFNGSFFSFNVKRLVKYFLTILVLSALWQILISEDVLFKERYLSVFQQKLLLQTMGLLVIFIFVLPLVEEWLLRNCVFIVLRDKIDASYLRVIISIMFALLYVSWFPFYFSDEIFLLFVVSMVITLFREKSNSFFQTLVLRITCQLLIFGHLFLVMIM